MSESQYVDLLWRIITVQGVIIGALVVVVWGHIVSDRKVRVELQQCKDALGINGDKRR